MSGHISGVRHPILVQPFADSPRTQRLFEALRELYPVDFVETSSAAAAHCKTAILFETNRAEIEELAKRGIRCLGFSGEVHGRASCSAKEVSFAADDYLDICFRGRTLSETTITNASQLPFKDSDIVAVNKGDQLLWIYNKHLAAQYDIIGFAPPELGDGDYLVQHFCRDNWFRLFPLLHFLAEVCLNPSQTFRPARAMFMFDDPNLHWNTYGHIDFVELANRAREYKYHTAFATIPLDAWFTNQKTAELFRANPDLISLLVHGNDHTHEELARNYPVSQRMALVGQALQRIARLERKAALKVSRVMAAPHGACTDSMADVLLQMGFEAACISWGSLMRYNPHVRWPLAVGLRPCECLGSGFPIIPRFRIGRTCQIEIILSAFLGQPIIPVGHHSDVAEGLDLLDELAMFIQKLPNVQWMDMEGISRSNYVTFQTRRSLCVVMYSRRVRITIPEGVDQLQVATPWLTTAHQATIRMHRESGADCDFYMGQDTPIKSMNGETVELLLPALGIPEAVPSRSTPVWGIARRQACEVRDRLLPMARGLIGTKKTQTDKM